MDRSDALYAAILIEQEIADTTELLEGEGIHPRMMALGLEHILRLDRARQFLLAFNKEG